MTYQVTWSRQAARAVQVDLPEAVAVACLEFILGALASNPKRVGKALNPPMDGLYSARRGEFRVLYEIQEQQVLVHVVTIRHRRDVYRS